MYAVHSSLSEICGSSAVCFDRPQVSSPLSLFSMFNGKSPQNSITHCWQAARAVGAAENKQQAKLGKSWLSVTAQAGDANARP